MKRTGTRVHWEAKRREAEAFYKARGEVPEWSPLVEIRKEIRERNIITGEPIITRTSEWRGANGADPMAPIKLRPAAPASRPSSDRHVSDAGGSE